MSSLKYSKGLFNLEDSDNNVGSFFMKADVASILNLTEDQLSIIPFKVVDSVPVIDELKLQKILYSGSVITLGTRISFDEVLLCYLIKQALPGCIITPQVRIGRFSMDLKLEYNSKALFIEFDGPHHFCLTRYGIPKHTPLRKKQLVEDATGIEVVNWPYWVQRCESNILALFDHTVIGKGALWSTGVHFGSFVFEDVWIQ